jgi:hypothetical protein
MAGLRIIRVGPSHPHAASIHETLLQIPDVEVVGACEAVDLGQTLRDLHPDAAIMTLAAIVQAARGWGPRRDNL